MPVRQYLPARPSEYAEVVDRLATEWRSPDPLAAEPVILEERDRQGVVRHVYVVWEEWAHLPRETRGEVIMDAADNVEAKKAVKDITIAMALTANEADRFRLKWRA